MASFALQRRQLVDTGKRLAERRLIAGCDGNISVRVARDRLLVTPSGLNKGRLRPSDLVVTDLAGRKIEGDCEASSEIRMHLYAYAQRPDVGAVVHAHPPCATAFAVAGRPLPADVLPEVIALVGQIPLTEYAAPGTDEVPGVLEPYIAAHTAFLLRNHGVLTLGYALEEAYHRMETVEQYAHILMLAAPLGELSRVPARDLERLTGLRPQYPDAAGRWNDVRRSVAKRRGTKTRSKR